MSLWWPGFLVLISVISGCYHCYKVHGQKYFILKIPSHVSVEFYRFNIAIIFTIKYVNFDFNCNINDLLAYLKMSLSFHRFVQVTLSSSHYMATYNNKYKTNGYICYHKKRFVRETVYPIHLLFMFWILVWVQFSLKLVYRNMLWFGVFGEEPL